MHHRHADEFARGSYSYMAVGATGDDVLNLAKSEWNVI